MADNDAARSPQGLWPQVLVVLAVLLGVAGIGVRGGRVASPDPKSSAAKQAPDATDAAADKRVPLAPTPLLRPLDLLATAAGLDPVFVAGPDGRPDLAPAYRRSLSSRERDCTAASWGQDRACEIAVLEQVQQQLTERRMELTIVIATLPDWVDSSLKWTFDAQLEAIQTAAARLSYVPAAYDLLGTASSEPKQKEGGRNYPMPKLHETTPGGIVFSSSSHPGDTPRTRLLLVLLVGETPTGGVHHGALATAVEFARAWQDFDADRKEHPTPIKILGPTYSGSAPSLRLVLDTGILKSVAARRLPRPGRSERLVDIVTPSASTDDNTRQFQDPAILFRPVVRSDSEVLRGIANFLGTIDVGWQCGVGVAMLVEANTRWGSQILATHAPSKQRGDECSQCTAQPQRPLLGERPEDAAQSIMPCAALVPFPIHISRLRSELTSAASAPPVPQPGTQVSLDLGETTPPVDRIPAVTPELTGATVELMVAGMFQAIDRREITAIGVMATDKRDHVFLAEQVARHRPNVLMFTLESNLIYLHPDVSSYVRGTIVASTYSLNERSQDLTRPKLARQYPAQFGAAAAHGAFNGLLLLLGGEPHMLDYDGPAAFGDEVATDVFDGPCRPDSGGRGCSPPVWISVSGRDALLPLTASRACCGGYAYSADRSAPTGVDSAPKGRERLSDYLKPHWRFLVVPALLLAFAEWRNRHWLERMRRRLRHTRLAAERQLAGTNDEAARSWAVRTRDLTREAVAESAASSIAIRGVVDAGWLWFAKLLLVFLADAAGLSLAAVVGAAAVFAVVAFAMLSRYALRLVGTFWPFASYAAPRRRLALALLLGFVLCVLAWNVIPPYLGRGTAAAAWSLVASIAFGCLAAYIDVPRIGRWAEWQRPERLRRIPALLGLGAYVCLVCNLALPPDEAVEMLLWAERATLLTSLVSPSLVIAAFCAAVYWWGNWNVRRVELLRSPEIEVGVGEFLADAARRAGLAADKVLRSTQLSVNGLLVLPLAAAVIAIGRGYDNVGTIDGRSFNGFLLLGSACILTAFAHTLAHTWRLGANVIRLLAALRQHAASPLFALLRQEPLDLGLGYGVVRRQDLQCLVARIDSVAASIADWNRAAVAVEGFGTYHWDRIRASSTRAADIVRIRAGTERFSQYTRRTHWRVLDDVIREYVDVLNASRWSPGRLPDSATGDVEATLKGMEYVVVLHAAIILRDLMTRLIAGFTAAAGGFLILLAAHLLYDFQGRIFWLGLDALAIGLASAVAFGVFIALEKDTVLSQLWGTTPGRLSLFGGLTPRMAGYGLITLATLFSVFFPEVVGNFSGWLSPLVKLMQ